MTPDVGCLSVYILLLLVDKYSYFGQWLSRVNPGRKFEQRYIEKEGRVRETTSNSQRRKIPESKTQPRSNT